ncbi:hypothetical protein TNCV_581801 [Trichonephila clavipes]|nr:hypothetical protein TNCV_581801 [Trichonephila clavipes]
MQQITSEYYTKLLSEGRFDLSTFRSERTNEASTLTITPKRSSSRDVVHSYDFEDLFNSIDIYDIIKWCKRFSVGRESTEDDQSPGRLVTVSGVETVTKMNQIVRADRQMSLRRIVEARNADKETVR